MNGKDGRNKHLHRVPPRWFHAPKLFPVVECHGAALAFMGGEAAALLPPSHPMHVFVGYLGCQNVARLPLGQCNQCASVVLADHSVAPQSPMRLFCSTITGRSSIPDLCPGAMR